MISGAHMSGLIRYRGPLELGDKTPPNGRNNPSNSTIVRESIADAHRTRELWQHRATSGGDIQSKYGPVHSHQWVMNSLHRKAQSHSPNDHDWSTSPVTATRVTLRHKSGPSTQMERQIKEHRSALTGGSVRNTIRGFESDFNGTETGNGSSPQWSPREWNNCGLPGKDLTIDPLETEKLLLIHYLKSHPQVIQGLGIHVPGHVINSGPFLDMKVELMIVDKDEGSPSLRSDRTGSIGDIRHGFAIGNQSTDGHNTWHSDGHATLPRYEKQYKGSSTEIIERRRSQSDMVHNSTPRQWKMTTWDQPPPPPFPPDDMNGYVDENGIVYRSVGESIIAREIREYKEKEDELRRSRSQLGMTPMEDADYKPKEAVSEFQTCAEMNTELSYPTQEKVTAHPEPVSSPVRARPVSTVSTPSQRNSHVIGGGGHTVAAYPPDLKKAITEVQNGGYTNLEEGDFMPVEARIEREMEDLRRREVELKRQRESMGIRYNPVGLAQFTPRPSMSEYDAGNVNSAPINRIQIIPNGHHHEDVHKTATVAEAKTCIGKKLDVLMRNWMTAAEVVVDGTTECKEKNGINDKLASPLGSEVKPLHAVDLLQSSNVPMKGSTSNDHDTSVPVVVREPTSNFSSTPTLPDCTVRPKMCPPNVDEGIVSAGESKQSLLNNGQVSKQPNGNHVVPTDDVFVSL